MRLLTTYNLPRLIRGTGCLRPVRIARAAPSTALCLIAQTTRIIIQPPNLLGALTLQRYKSTTPGHGQCRQPPNAVTDTHRPTNEDYLHLAVYSFAPDPGSITASHLETVQSQFLTSFATWHVLGRVYLSQEGVNAQIICPRDRLSEVKSLLVGSRLLHPTRHEWIVSTRLPLTKADGSVGSASQSVFTTLRVKIRPQIVSDGLPVPAAFRVHECWADHQSPAEFDRRVRQYLLTQGATVNQLPIAAATTTNEVRSSPTPPPAKEVNPTMKNHPDHPAWFTHLPAQVDVPTGDLPAEGPCLLDLRNHYETEIGRFVGARQFDSDTFQGAVQAMGQLLERETDKNREVLMYCTTGIRCTKAGAYLRSQGFNNVHVLKGGITAYGHWATQKAQPSLFVGKNFTFDGRRGEPVTDDVVGRCHQCGTPCDRYTNCINTQCHLLFLQCEACNRAHRGTCGRPACLDPAGHPKRPYDYHQQIRPRDALGGGERNPQKNSATSAF
ncbi:hypothetical protein IWQ60_011974 [Tieghemiomyces parasiticus]|uniref:Rhodanese domain-containing protein n=1 Tax=Tieghemiomyces parasiticus TaxID=78921 RepID=A0A9W7ZIN8_9FUNG|nr:hypothetical protein IWQ60_011974 [Tieghemiomyces parasiticus]